MIGPLPDRRGPLQGLRIVEFAGLGPAPFCCMLLADLGADIICIDRPGSRLEPRDITRRGRHVLTLDLKSASDRETCWNQIAQADVLVEGFRPRVMEKLGLGPAEVRAHNPRLIYARMTGWGQDGPLSASAGHDINYIAITGALAAIGPAQGKPCPPLNLVGDFGGGSLYLALGILSALYERERSGIGQVIDAAIVDGTASFMNFFHGIAALGLSTMDRKESLLSGQAPFYGCYECSDGNYVSVGAIEPHFFAQLLELLGVDAAHFPAQYDRSRWLEGRAILTEIFMRQPRDAWCAMIEGTDACFAPVLTLDEARNHPHMASRQIYVERDGIVHAQPAPRFSRTPGAIAPPARMMAESKSGFDH